MGAHEQVLERLIIGLLCNGNLLVEGLPGLGKTRAVKRGIYPLPASSIWWRNMGSSRS